MKAALVLLCLLAGCKTTCDKAVDRMMKCKLVVPNLLGHTPPVVFDDEMRRALDTMCDVADSPRAEAVDDKAAMECAAAASSCKELMACHM